MKKFFQKFEYNAPVILTFTILAFIIQILNSIPGSISNVIHNLFVAQRGSLLNPLFYIRLFTHVLGHANWSHLIGNFTYILLVGPILEEKYGSKQILSMMAITALLTSIISIIFFPHVALCGASGIVFMFILLASCSNVSNGKIPVTLLLAGIFYIGKECIDAFGFDNISQLSHIIGGICGAAFGFIFSSKKKIS